MLRAINQALHGSHVALLPALPPGLPHSQSAPRPAHARACRQEMIDDGQGTKLSLEKILEELGTTFSYVSEFLRKVRACAAPRMHAAAPWGRAGMALLCRAPVLAARQQHLLAVFMAAAVVVVGLGEQPCRGGR